MSGIAIATIAKRIVCSSPPGIRALAWIDAGDINAFAMMESLTVTM